MNDSFKSEESQSTVYSNHSVVKKRKKSSPVWENVVWDDVLQKYLCIPCQSLDPPVIKEYSRTTGKE